MIIIGILAAVALPQYTKVAEKARSAEAKHILGVLRKAQMMYYTEYGTYASIPELGVDVQDYACDSNHYFAYWVDWGDGSLYADRCGDCIGMPGKSPDANDYCYGYIWLMDDQIVCGWTAGIDNCP